MVRRRLWRVASLIMSTKTDLSAMARSLRNASPLQTLICSQHLKDLFPKRLDVEARWALSPLPDVDKMSGNRRRRRHRRRNQMRAAFKSLAALEIAVRGRGAALFRGQLVGIHRKAHRAARFAPFESGLDEDLVEAFGFCLFLHDARAG